jgi:hypothetical protein
VSVPGRRLILLAALALGLPAIATAQNRPTTEAEAAAGGYLLSNGKGAARCMILLRTVPVKGGMAVGFPVHCRMAMPVLVKAAAWSVERIPDPPRGRVRFHDEDGKVVLDFNRMSGDDVSGDDETGVEHILSPVNGRSMPVRFGDIQPSRQRQEQERRAAAGPTTTPATAADVSLMAATAGTYALARGRDRSQATGCMVALSPPSGDGGVAALLAGCQDRGLTFFAPSRWSISGGVLWLLNARGQKLSFDRNRAGGWDKSAGQGEPLSLVRN